jgi:hypothetical protein
MLQTGLRLAVQIFAFAIIFSVFCRIAKMSVQRSHPQEFDPIERLTMAMRVSRSGRTPTQAATNAGLSCRETREKRSLERKRERCENVQAKRDTSSGAGNTQRSTRAVSSLAQRFQSTGDDAPPPPGDANVSGMAAILPCQFHEKMNKWLLTTNKISSFITKEASTSNCAPGRINSEASLSNQ